MSSLIINRSRSRSTLLWQTHGIRIRSVFSLYNSHPVADSSDSVSASGFSSDLTTSFRTTSFGFKYGEISHLNQKFRNLALPGSSFVSTTPPFSLEAVAVASTCDGITVARIIANQWRILDENEGDWKSHAEQFHNLFVIKRRLQWKKLLVRLRMLSAELNKPDLWDIPNYAGKISQEHGWLTGKMKGVITFERELLEHIDILKLAEEENDSELESVGVSRKL